MGAMNLWQWRNDNKLVSGDEIVLCSQNGVSLYEGEERMHWQDGKLTLSTHNMFFQPLGGGLQVLQLPLETIDATNHGIYSKARFGFSHAKIIVPLLGGNGYMKFSFRNGGMEEFFQGLRQALREKQWLRYPVEPAPKKTNALPLPPQQRPKPNLQLKIPGQHATQQQHSSVNSREPIPSAPALPTNSTLKTSSTETADSHPNISSQQTAPSQMTMASPVKQAFASSAMTTSWPQSATEMGEYSTTRSDSVFAITDKAGIAGLMRASAESGQLSEALRDIEDVMNKASFLVANIRYLRQKQNSGSGIPSEDDTAIEGIEATLGLGAMVRASSNGTAHGQFHQELAWELHSWMTHEKNKRIFGTMPLVPLIELFSLYNKARGGSDLVSPSDVLLACRAMEKQEYSRYTLKKLSSGRLALQHKDPSLVLERLSRILGPVLCNPRQRDARTFEKQQISVPKKTSFPTSSDSLKSINEVQFAAVLQVGRSVAFDLLEELEARGYICRSGGALGCVAFHWNIFVF